MKAILLISIALCGVWATKAISDRQHAQEMLATAQARTDVPRVTSEGTLLPSGWVLHPAGRQIPTGDMPVAMSVSPGGGWLLVSTAGYAPCQVLAIDVANEQVQTTQTLDQTWEGMAFGVEKGAGTVLAGKAGTDLYVSGGGRALLWRFGWDERGGDLIPKTPLPVADLIGRESPYVRPKTAKANGWIAGIATDPATDVLYVLNNQQNTLYALDALTGKALVKAPTGDHPNALLLAPQRKRLFVTNQGSASVSVYQIAEGEDKTGILGVGLSKLRDVAVGQQPVALLMDSKMDGTISSISKIEDKAGDKTGDTEGSRSGRRLFVANSGSNTLSVINTETLEVQETIRTSLFPNAPTGSTPNALAISPDGKRLFVTNADNNDVAVIDISKPTESRVVGFIPTGWYPTAVAVSPDGKKLFVGNGKGLASKPSYPRKGGGVGLTIYNNGPTQSYGPNHDQRLTFDYICSLVGGAVSIIDMPDDAQLARYTAQVLASCPYRDAYLTTAPAHSGHSVIPAKVGQRSPIEHVLYIIKENRTYDQVLGDLKDGNGKPVGNGDPNLTLFGETVTPNHHALAQQFVLLDNLYCNGEVSEDGHQWCNAAFCTDWTQKVYTGNYATPSRGDATGNEAVITSPGGYLWDNCKAHDRTYRTYGEFTSFRSDRDNAPIATSSSPALNGHISIAWEQAARQGKRRDYQRADAFIEELKQAEQSGEWPNYMVMSLGEDHTVGLTPGLPTPWASVASNDYALGKIVEAVSHSKFWPHTAIFIIEDDAQAGPDHVDAHRTVGFVASPYIKRRSIDHTLYTTSSFLRTMELLLGLPPMTQYDAGATPLFACFIDRPDLTPYKALEPKTDLAATTPRPTPARSASARPAAPKLSSSRYASLQAEQEDSTPLDFSAYDRCDPDTLNRLLWHAIKGKNSPYPGPTVGARLAGGE